MAEPYVPAHQISASADMRQKAPIRLGMVGGGLGAFIGGVHRAAARLDNRYELVAGVFSEEPQEAAMSARLLHIPEDRAYETYQQMAEREANRSDRGRCSDDCHAKLSPLPNRESFCRTRV